MMRKLPLLRNRKDQVDIAGRRLDRDSVWVSSIEYRDGSDIIVNSWPEVKKLGVKGAWKVVAWSYSLVTW